MAEPASIRYNNPGAMWGGNAISRKWGETANIGLNDGTGQGNRIAVFPTKVAGACAQFDLWRSSKNYRNKRLDAAIRTWSGGNSSSAYVNFLIARVPGLTAGTIINDAFLSSPSGVLFMKAQAWHEAGKPYPMTDAEWREAQARVFGQATAPAAAPAKTAAVVVATATAAGTAAAATQDGISWTGVAIVAAVAAAAILAGYLIWRARRKEA